MKRSAVWVAAALVTASLAGLPASSEQDDSAAKKEHIILLPEDVKWVDGPPSIPAGAKMAVLDGDPKKAGLFVMRLKLPAGYKIPPHWHPADERVTVLTGKFHVGLGEKADESKAKALTPGSYFSFPPKSSHFASTSEETIVQLSTIGPWDLTYVNPDEDPRKSK